MKNLTLPALGWNEHFQSQIQNIRFHDYQIGRVITENKTNYGVLCTSGEFTGEVTGKLMYGAASEGDLPKVGDWVVTTIMDESKVMIHQVLERKTQLSRKAVGKKMAEQIIVTNIDVLFIVQGLDDNFNVARLERYLTAVRNIEAVIVLNKADLCEDIISKVAEIRNRIRGIAVIATSTVAGNLQSLQDYIQEGKTFAFVGSSGVGKSTLINSLLHEDHLKTTTVREKDSKGRHTTTRREMIFLSSGGILIDTPGMREFQPWSDEENVSVAFQDIYALSSNCRYADCQHVHEDHCAVKDAIGSGEISEAHYSNYLRLRRELEYQESLTDVNKAQVRKKNSKQLIKAYKKIVRNKRSGG